MGAVKRSWGIRFQVLSVFVFCCIPLTAYGVTLYKQYLVRQYRHQDVLCEPYIVQPNDYVLKLFKQKGNIADKDFPEFLHIFKSINPDIGDINTILIGQRILIPLEKISPHSFPEQDDGVVKVPFMTISNLRELTKAHTVIHKVQKGESISAILAHNLETSDRTHYRELLELVRQLNPHLDDINRIYPGQKIIVPVSSLCLQPWYSSLFDPGGNLAKDVYAAASRQRKAADDNAGNESAPLPPSATDMVSGIQPPFQRAAGILGAKLMDRGIYYFPGSDKNGDIRIDLARSPLMEFNNGGKILFCTADTLESFTRQQANNTYFRPIKIIPTVLEASTKDILESLRHDIYQNPDTNTVTFTDHAIKVKIQSVLIPGKTPAATAKPQAAPQQRIALALIDHPAQQVPKSIRQFLAHKNILTTDILLKSSSDPNTSSGTSAVNPPTPLPPMPVRIQASKNYRQFVKELSTALEFWYESDITISFFYHGIQIKAASNLISNGKGHELLVDFGNLQGDAVDAVAQSGFNIISLHYDETISSLVRKILSGLHTPYEENPTISLAQRPEAYNIALTFTGFKLRDNKGNDTLITKAPVDRDILKFLAECHIRVILIEFPDR